MKINVITWINGKGYEIRERSLNTYLDNDGHEEKMSAKGEVFVYETKGEEAPFIKDSKALETYDGMQNDYEKDALILQFTGQYEMNASMYEAMKYVTAHYTDEWSKSPYSLSYYSSKNIGWGYKPEGSLRVSDHWNFGEDGEHCPTSEPVEGWAVCQFNNGKYDLIKKFY